MSEAVAATPKQFILQTGATAEEALVACYQVESLRSIRSILHQAMLVLSCEDAQVALSLGLEHLDEQECTALLAALRTTANQFSQAASRPEAIRRMLIELATLVKQRTRIGHRCVGPS
jgi:hypothetical protein